MNNLYLTSPKLKVVSIKKETTAKYFSELNVGDVFQLRVKMKGRGRNGRSIYATYFEVSINNSEFVTTTHTLNTIASRLRCFELEVVE